MVVATEPDPDGTSDLEPDLRRALETLAEAGLDPRVVAHRRADGAARAS
jgi:hypothetical protein